jgi:hypothetical protein
MILNRKELNMWFNKPLTRYEAVKIASKDKNLPQSIHKEVIKRFEDKGKFGILSFISLEKAIIKEVVIDNVEYYEITFIEGDMSYQEINYKTGEPLCYYDGQIADDLTAKCLINKKNKKFKYIGTCNIGIEVN